VYTVDPSSTSVLESATQAVSTGDPSSTSVLESATEAVSTGDPSSAAVPSGKLSKKRKDKQAATEAPKNKRIKTK
jgi:HAMP domain-containing protein